MMKPKQTSKQKRHWRRPDLSCNHQTHCCHFSNIPDNDKDTEFHKHRVLVLFRSQIPRFTRFLLYAELLTLGMLLCSLFSPTSLFPLRRSVLRSDSNADLHSDLYHDLPLQDHTSSRTSSSPLPDSFLYRNPDSSKAPKDTKKDYIHWVDFTVPNEALRQALRLDVDSYTTDFHLNWIELLACLAARYGGDFSRYKASDMDTLAEKIKSGTSMAAITEGMKYYAYYLEAYTAVLGGMVGVYEIQEPVSQDSDNKAAPNAHSDAGSDAGSDAALGSQTPAYRWVRKYGLKAFSPIAKNFPYQDFDDFGAARSYGFKRQHLGHDMMGQVGTPVIAVESGYVEAIGWNQYGGWRLGIRSFDQKRYYYYAHLRKNYPYHKSLKEGSIVQAGDVIGYLGRTGYSRTENTNNIEEPHLHFGIQLIFDESQKDGNHEIWINCYELVKFLQLNRSETLKNPETKEYSRVLEMKDPAVSGGV